MLVLLQSMMRVVHHPLTALLLCAPMLLKVLLAVIIATVVAAIGCDALDAFNACDTIIIRIFRRQCFPTTACVVVMKLFACHFSWM